MVTNKSLREKLVNQRETIRKLNERIDTQKTRITTLVKENNTLKAENKSFSLRIVSLEKAVADLNTKLYKAESFINEIRTLLESSYISKVHSSISKSIPHALDEWKFPGRSDWLKVNILTGFWPSDVLPNIDRQGWTHPGGNVPHMTAAGVMNDGHHSFIPYPIIHSTGQSAWLEWPQWVSAQFNPDPPKPHLEPAGFVQCIKVMLYNTRTWEYGNPENMITVMAAYNRVELRLTRLFSNYNDCLTLVNTLETMFKKY